ncbi:MAG: hypothetical protein WBG71_06790 [Leeuwenhoekiella sp.]
MSHSIEQIETELKKRWRYKYQWFRKQNDLWDRHSRFIYSVLPFEGLVENIARTVSEKNLDKKEFFYYSINRWYNFWSAVAVEQVFVNQPGVTASLNARNRLEDFSIHGITFDHKTTRFPKGFGKDLAYAKNNPQQLTQWLYNNQSTGQRQHYASRLFVVVHDQNGNHYKLKAEISWLATLVEDLVKNFKKENLIINQFTDRPRSFSAVIWATR